MEPLPQQDGWNDLDRLEASLLHLLPGSDSAIVWISSHSGLCKRIQLICWFCCLSSKQRSGVCLNNARRNLYFCINYVLQKRRAKKKQYLGYEHANQQYVAIVTKNYFFSFLFFFESERLIYGNFFICTVVCGLVAIFRPCFPISWTYVILTSKIPLVMKVFM